MTVAEKLFIAALKKRNANIITSINKKWLDKAELRKYHHILDYLRDNSELPGANTFCSDYGLDSKLADSKPAYYLEQLKERYLITELSEYLPSVLKKIKDEPKEVLQEIQEFVALLNKDEVSSKDTSYKEDATKRLEEYLLKAATGGVVDYSTGDAVLDAFFYGYRKKDLITIGGRAGSRKCLGKGTRLRMFDGTVKNVEDVKVDDLLMGNDGSHRKVLALYKGREQMYWVHQNKGMSYRVNESHILSLKDKRPINVRETIQGKRQYKKSGGCSNEVVNISVREYLQKSKTWKKYHKGYKGNLDFPSQKVLIDPYFLGLWLGDGGCHKVEITTEDIEIETCVRQYAKSLNLKVTTNKNQYAITTGKRGSKNPLISLFRQYGLLNNKSNKIDNGQKHIPKEYLLNSREVRLQLLAGLLDSDGSYAKRGYAITQKNKRLAEDIAFLARGLGYYVNSSETTTYLKSRNYSCKVTDLYISGYIAELPIRVPRKRPQPRLINKDHTITGITVVKDVVDDFYGFEIDGNHLFCLEDLTVTHNTFLLCFLALLAARALQPDAGPIVFITNETSAEEIKERIDCIAFKLPYSEFLSGTLSRKDYRRYKEALKSLESSTTNIIIVEDCYTLADVQTKIVVHNPSIMFIDGSYLLEPDEAEGWEKITKITRTLKRTSKKSEVPIINTTQMKRATGKGRKSTSFEAQDEFAFSNSYNADSDLSFLMYQDNDMRYYDEFGMQVGKGRRIDDKKNLIFVCPLATMELEFKIEKEGIDTPEEHTPEEIFY